MNLLLVSGLLLVCYPMAAPVFTPFPDAAPSRPVISSLQPTSGPAETLVTISGSGFTPTAGHRGGADADEDYGGNTVHFGTKATIRNMNSTDGVTVQFKIPQKIAPGSYNVKVVNSRGASNAVKFTVTAN